MKTKFEANVATQIPKTRMATEPRLPWDVSKADVGRSAFSDEALQSVAEAGTPLGVRPVFLVLLLLFVFTSMFYIFVRAASENEKARIAMREREIAISSLKEDLKETASEKALLSEKAVHLEKKVEDLGARTEELNTRNRDLETQNQTFVTVIEHLSKKEESAQE